MRILSSLILSISLLTTSGMIMADPAELPAGNYEQYCENCTASNGMLDCFCTNSKAVKGYHSLNIPPYCSYVEFKNDQLQCTAFNRPVPPRPEQVQRNFPAGPIWNTYDAERKCPAVCSGRGAYWTGQWNATRDIHKGICECRRTGGWNSPPGGQFVPYGGDNQVPTPSINQRLLQQRLQR